MTFAVLLAKFTGLPRWAHYLMLAAAGIAAFLIWDHFDDKAAVEAANAAREAKAVPAREQAANERLDDTIAIQKQTEDYNDAIDKAGDTGAPSPAALALACERLRKLGRIPAACRPEGSDSE